MPSILWILSQVSGSITVSKDGHGYDYADHEPTVVRYTTWYWVNNLVLNAIVTSLIVGRLFMANRQLKRGQAMGYKSYTKVILILVESGALYLGTLVLYLILFYHKVSS